VPDSSLLAYFSLTFILVITPGSTTAVVVRNTLEGGRRAGLFTALGAAVANSTHATLAGIGLSVLITTFPVIVLVVRLAGAAYLAWLGLMSLRRAWLLADGGLRLAQAEAAPSAPFAPLAPLRDGVAVNLLNPAIISFYVAIVPSFVPAGAPRLYLPMLAVMHVGMALLCHSLWATALGGVRRFFAPPWSRRALEALTGLALLALAARVLVG
jgi:threonine/homoserine/homoserine lactone efflux protein